MFFWLSEQELVTLKKSMHDMLMHIVHTSVFGWLLNFAPGYEVRHLIILSAQHGHRFRDVLLNPAGVLSQGCPHRCTLGIAV